MRAASIDIGTNTVLLLIADIDEHGNITTLEQHQRLPRLGKNVDANKVIHPSAFDRIVWILDEYKNLAKQLRADRVIACATSAVRDASNQSEFLSYLKNNTGISVEVLRGDEEAIVTYLGALSGLPSHTQQAVVLDIGGGSTEISFQQDRGQNGDKKLEHYSFQIGSVRLTERFLKHLPPLPPELESASQLIIEELSQVKNPGFHSYQLVGVAGTVTTLASLDQGLNEFDPEKVHGYLLTLDRVSFWLQKLATMTVSEIRELSSATEGRADILTAGVLILHQVMKLLGFPSVLVSERGLRYGLILREWEKLRGKVA